MAGPVTQTETQETSAPETNTNEILTGIGNRLDNLERLILSSTVFKQFPDWESTVELEDDRTRTENRSYLGTSNLTLTPEEARNFHHNALQLFREGSPYRQFAVAAERPIPASNDQHEKGIQIKDLRIMNLLVMDILSTALPLLDDAARPSDEFLAAYALVDSREMMDIFLDDTEIFVPREDNKPFLLNRKELLQQKGQLDALARIISEYIKQRPTMKIDCDHLPDSLKDIITGQKYDGLILEATRNTISTQIIIKPGFFHINDPITVPDESEPLQKVYR